MSCDQPLATGGRAWAHPGPGSLCTRPDPSVASPTFACGLRCNVHCKQAQSGQQRPAKPHAFVSASGGHLLVRTLLVCFGSREARDGMWAARRLQATAASNGKKHEESGFYERRADAAVSLTKGAETQRCCRKRDAGPCKTPVPASYLHGRALAPRSATHSVLLLRVRTYRQHERHRQKAARAASTPAPALELRAGTRRIRHTL